MCATGTILWRICLKAIRGIFFQYVVCDRRRDVLMFWWGRKWYSTERESSNFWTCRKSYYPPIEVSFIVGYPDLPIRKALRRVFGLLTVIILKRVSESIFFQSTIITTLKMEKWLKMENRSYILWRCSIY